MPVSGSRRFWKIGSRGHGIHSCEVFNINFGYIVQHLAFTLARGKNEKANNFIMEIRNENYALTFCTPKTLLKL